MQAVIKADRVLLKGGEIIDLSNGQRTKADIVIIDGLIDAITHIDENQFDGQIFNIAGNIVSPGLIDMHVHLREPGREDEETIESGCAAAMAGGFTAVCPMPNTSPPCDTQEVVRFLKKKSEEELVDIYPIAAATKRRAGEEITEMADLIRAGAVAFSDDGSPMYNTAVMRHALEYAGMYNAPIIDHCEDPYLSAGGHMNEGEMSTRLGIPGIPNMGEDIMIARNIELVRFTGGHVHIAHLSTRRGVELVRQAKNDGLKVTCEVTPHHLTLTDRELVDYNTNLKMNPPLRSAEDVEALREGLKDGTIDVIASDHAPHSIEEKVVEFDAAPFGIIGLETMLSVILTRLVQEGKQNLQDVLFKMAVAPRKILNLPVPQVKPGQAANLTIFDPGKEWTVEASKLRSLSRNTPYDGWKLKGVVFAVVNKGMLWRNTSASTPAK